jgi:ubiquinone/menaquinone biosynthesis C-methylase UbiE
MNKGSVSNLLRKMKLMYPADYARYIVSKIRNKKKNREFLRNNPGIVLPPDYLMYESFRLDYYNYYTESLETAEWVINLISKHKDLNKLKILDWGCGPGRVVRHLPSLLGSDCKIYGTDYNTKSIEWCRKSLPGIEFNVNTGEASLPYPDNFFGAIYGLSIITHLSEQNHYNWVNELFRILEPGGLLILSSQGNNFRFKLSAAEQERFDKGELIIRGNVKEGHRTFSAFHPKQFMEKLFAEAEILEHIEREPEGGSIPQDVWIVRKI